MIPAFAGMTSATGTAAALVPTIESSPRRRGSMLFSGPKPYSQRFFTKTSQASTQAPAVIAETMENACNSPWKGSGMFMP